MRAVGVDGCRGGWLAVPLEGGEAVVHPTFADLLRAEPDATLAVDVPIGLPDEGRTGDRACDKAARRLLGFPRRTSVFPPPLRHRLHATERPPEMGHQSFGILPRIREADALFTPSLQARCVEAHPELAFALLAGRPMRHAKRTAEGKAERRRALARVPGTPFARLPGLPRGAAMDDLLDACVLAWTAARVARGESLRVPEAPPVDSRGLRMEIHA